MPLLQTFRSLFLRVPPAAAAPAPVPAAERRWPPPPPRAAAEETHRSVEWDTVPTAPPAACADSILDADVTTLDRDTADAGPKPTTEIAPPPGPWPENEVSLRDDSPRSSVSRVGSAVRRPRARSVPESARPAPSSIRAAFPDHSAASGAMWPDDEDQAAVSKREGELVKSDLVRGGTTSSTPASNRRARAHVFALTGELPIARID